jgi:chemotaxis protein methyltransferase WspC
MSSGALDEQRFSRFLRERIGLDVASVGAALIERAVLQRCVAVGARDAEGYWGLLLDSAEEQQALIEAVIVPETWFLRYPESFAALARLARERLGQLKGTRPLRILSLPCSTGEEPYSIAMSLLDAGVAPQLFKVDGIDVSPLSVARAQRATYGRNSFRGQDTSFRERHFSVVDDSYTLNESVRRQVRLLVGNVLDPALLGAEPPYDFVFCRNLLIYFDVATQKRVFEVLKGLTQADGALFIGPAEGSLLTRMGMRPLGIPGAFAFVRQSEPVPSCRVVSARLPTPHLPAEVPARPHPVLPTAQAYAPKARQAQPGDEAAALLASIASLADEGSSAEAQAACERYLKQYQPNAQVYYWQGLLCDVAGNAHQAHEYYRKALYLQPHHAEALAHLAALLAARGDAAGARRLQERAARSARSANSERDQ